MQTLLVYFAPTPTGTSASIAARLQARYAAALRTCNLAEVQHVADVELADSLLFIAATYGDQELNDTMERFVTALPADLAGTAFTVCEVGNYYGYDDFEFGAAHIIGCELEKRGARMARPCVSIDSLPRLDERKLARWIDSLSDYLG